MIKLSYNNHSKPIELCHNYSIPSVDDIEKMKEKHSRQRSISITWEIPRWLTRKGGKQ